MKTKIAGVMLALARRILTPRPHIDTKVEPKVETKVEVTGDAQVNIQHNVYVVVINGDVNKKA